MPTFSALRRFFVSLSIAAVLAATAAHASQPKISVQQNGWAFDLKIFPIDIKGQRDISIIGTRSDGAELVTGGTLPRTDSLEKGSPFDVPTSVSYRFCRAAFQKNARLSFDGTVLRVAASFTGEDLKRCQTNQGGADFDIAFTLGQTERSQLNLPGTAAEVASCAAEVASKVTPAKLTGAIGRIGIQRETPTHDVSYWGQRWRTLLVTDFTQTGPAKFAMGGATAWSYGEEIEIVKVAIPAEPYSRGILQIKRIRDGKVGFVDASTVVTDRPETCSTEALIHRGISVLFEISAGVKLVDADGNWVTDPSVTHGLCDQITSKGLSCLVAGHPSGKLFRFTLEQKDAKPLFAVPGRAK